MDLKVFEFNMLPTNTYVVWDDGGEALLIDPACYGQDEQQILARFLTSKGLKVRHILCTHFHFDHVFGVPFAETQCGIRCEAHEGDTWWAEHNADEARAFGIPYPGTPPTIGHPLADGDVIQCGTLDFQCLYTPGHSRGGVCFYCAAEGLLFAGDTLFAYGGVGRTDLHGGDYGELIHSVRTQLFTLPETTMVYPGHGSSTTIRTERMFHNL
ncbi:MAG: MBL fold metallo-hydrolase [Bacteroidaceae bacterium]|nr:MBL fold metallo-hydrolase [Bacteroidaceae bacterium]